MRANEKGYDCNGFNKMGYNRKGHNKLEKKKKSYDCNISNEELSNKTNISKSIFSVINLRKIKYEDVVSMIEQDEVMQIAYVKESAYMAQHILMVTPPEMENALPGIELAKEYEKLNPNITNASSVEEAVEIATILAGKDTVVAAFGTTAILERYRKVVDAIK